MSLLGTLESPFKWIGGEAKTAIQALVPPELEAKIGLFAHTFTANLVHDVAAEASSLTDEIVGDVWAAIESAAKTLAPEVLSGKISFVQAIETGVADLKSAAAATMLPALKTASAQTISNWLPNLITTSLAAALANPTSQPVSSPAASSSEPS